MTWLLCAVLAVPLCAITLSAAHFQFRHHTVTVPDGFEVEIAAEAPLVERPIEVAFDPLGRLYVTDSSGSNDKPEKQLQDKPHRIVRLEDADGDGRYDKSVVFADRMMFPEGAMWHGGSLYVAAPPSIWKLTDANDDGVAERREEWFQGKTLTGCANDLHGPYLGPDGFFYWTKGAFAEQTYARPGKAPFVTRAAHIFRARSDGSGLEPVMAGGMDNPVGLTFTLGGERIFSTTFLQHPAGGRRDGLIHAVYGGVYGKPHDVIDGHTRTGDLMPVMTHLGPAAPAGLLSYQSKVFGGDYAQNIFAALFNLHKITRHILVPQGATFETHDSDFFVSDSTDFHPTDVIESADGSLLVIDTGGWYKLCCPTSQLSKPDLLGAIYRVRRKKAEQLDDPWGVKIGWARAKPAAIVRLLDDDRPAVQARAIEDSARRGAEIVPYLRAATTNSSSSTRLKLNALWATTRIHTESARQCVRSALEDRNATVRSVAVQSISVWRDAQAANSLAALLTNDSSLHVKRVAAEALGRIGASAAATLLQAADSHNDRVLEHSIIYALIEINDPAATKKAIAERRPGASRAALIALDQMEGAGLSAEFVIEQLRSPHATVQQTAEWIAGRHPEWALKMVPFFEDSLLPAQSKSEQRKQTERLLQSFSGQAPIQAMLGRLAAEPKLSKESRLAILTIMGRSRLKTLPPSWSTTISRLLLSDDEDVVVQAVAVARTSPAANGKADVADALLSVARDKTHRPEIKLDALAALPASSPLDASLFLLASRGATSASQSERNAALTALAKASLSTEQTLLLCDSIKTLGPLELPKLLSVFSRSTNEAVGARLVAVLKESPALATLQPAALRPYLTNYPATIAAQADALFVTTNKLDQRRRLEQIESELPMGDIRRGQALFNSSRTACSSCHAIGYLGGTLGPDLTRIGQIRTERDLLEAILYPSASFVRSYEPVVAVTRSGEQHSGVLRKDSAEELVLATSAETEVKIPRLDLTDLQPGTVSVMPEGLDQQLSRQELADLLAFLKATRW